MNRTLYSVLLIALLMGIQPVLAQSGEMSEEERLQAQDKISKDESSEEERLQAQDKISKDELSEEERLQAQDKISKDELSEEERLQAQDKISKDAISEEERLQAQDKISKDAISEEERLQAQDKISKDDEPIIERPSATISDEDIPDSIRFNRYYRESLRLAKLAQETYNYGDYDASASIAQEAIYYATLSDVFVAIAIAKSRIDWAVASGASKQFPVEFREAETWYNESLSARDAEEWENSIEAAHKVIDILAYISAPAGSFALPARYTVRTWITVKDCLWNIAGRPWVYGNPRQWRVLYDANKSKLPDPNNPNLIEPGMVLDIPSIRGETRQGEWSSNRTYPPVR